MNLDHVQKSLYHSRCSKNTQFLICACVDSTIAYHIHTIHGGWLQNSEFQVTKHPQVLYWHMVIHGSCAYVLHVKIAHANLSFAKTHKNLWHKFCASVTCHDIFQCQLLTIVFKEKKLGVDYFTINLTSNVKLK